MHEKEKKMQSILILSAFEGSILSFKGPLIEDLIKKKYIVHVLAPNFSKKTSNKLINMGAKPYEISLSRNGLNPFEDLLNLIKLIIIMQKIKPDIFLGYYIKPVIWGSLAAFIARVPKRVAMIEGLGVIFTKKRKAETYRTKIVRKLISFLYKLSLSVSQFVLFLNDDDKREFEDKKIIKKNKANVIGGIGIRLNEWPFSLPSNKNINFLFVGRIVSEKGIGEFIEAATIIKNKYPSTYFTALGEIEERERKFNKTYLNEIENQGIVSFPGHVEVIKYYKDCSVFVLPSYREGVPRSTQEAMSIGRPIITTDAPGCKDTVLDEVNGFLVEVGNTEELVKAMEKFILNPDLILSMGQQSRTLAEEKYEVRAVNKKIFKYINI